MSTSNQPDPAVKSYFFGKGYEDLRDTIREAWGRNLDSAKSFWEDSRNAVHNEGFGMALAVLWFGASVSVFVFGTLFTIILSILHIILLASFFSLIYLGFSLVAGVEGLVFLVRRFASVCPVCHTHLGLPTYLCPACGQEHPRLVPSRFGILWHKCRCGEKLPCTIFTNRGELQSKCPHCDNFLSREHTETPKAFLPIIGGPSVGKSAYLFALCRYLHEQAVPETGRQAQFLEQAQAASYDEVVEGMEEGKTPQKTFETIPRAFDLLLQKDGQADAMLYIYDPAGEAFNDTSQLTAHKFLGYLSGVIFLVDPFAIPAVSHTYEKQLKELETQIRPSYSVLEDTLTRVLNILESEYGLSPTDKIKKPFAVVINKVDSFDLEDVIGMNALKHFPPKPGESHADRQNRLIKEQLIEWGEGPLVHALDTRFTNVRYFTVSALGRVPDDSEQPFIPRRIAEPALWILAHDDKRWEAG
jgi:hypothetical protein